MMILQNILYVVLGWATLSLINIIAGECRKLELNYIVGLAVDVFIKAIIIVYFYVIGVGIHTVFKMV